MTAENRVTEKTLFQFRCSWLTCGMTQKKIIFQHNAATIKLAAKMPAAGGHIKEGGVLHEQGSSGDVHLSPKLT